MGNLKGECNKICKHFEKSPFNVFNIILSLIRESSYSFTLSTPFERDTTFEKKKEKKNNTEAPFAHNRFQIVGGYKIDLCYLHELILLKSMDLIQRNK